MPYRIKYHIEHPIGILSAGLASIGLSEYTELVVNGVISLVIGGLMVIITHFIKRALQNKYPIKKT